MPVSEDPAAAHPHYPRLVSTQTCRRGAGRSVYQTLTLIPGSAATCCRAWLFQGPRWTGESVRTAARPSVPQLVLRLGRESGGWCRDSSHGEQGSAVMGLRGVIGFNWLGV